LHRQHWEQVYNRGSDFQARPFLGQALFAQKHPQAEKDSAASEQKAVQARV